MFNFFKCSQKRVVRHNITAIFLQPQVIKKPEMILDITITIPAPKKKEPKLIPIKVFTTFVKIGYNQYKIYIDPFQGIEYVTIDGERFEIERPVFGTGGWLRPI